MAKCPNCKSEVVKPAKNWNYGIFTVKMYKCNCGNQFREYYKGDEVRFVLSAHNGGLGRPRKNQKVTSSVGLVLRGRYNMDIFLSDKAS